MTPDRVLDELDSADLAEFMAYDRIEPFGPWRDDYRAAIVAQTVAASVGAETSVADYMPRFEASADADAAREQRVVDKLKLWASAMRQRQEQLRGDG